jgi:glycine/D-amino acid oxidase-like deaminating enzyme
MDPENEMFQFNDNMPITFSDPLPEKVDVAIIGAGVIGISTAWHLLKQGLSVLVVDKGRVAGEQSSRNWGWVRVTWRDEAEVPIAIDSLNCWQEMSEELDEDLGFTRNGILGLAATSKELAEFESWMSIAKDHELDTRMISRSEAKSLIKISQDQWLGGMVTPSDARAEPFKAVPAIARGVQARGGLVREACAVRALDFEGGEVSGIYTELGRVKAAAVVCAAGAWSNMFLSNMGIDLPQLTVRGTVVRTEKAPEIYPGAAALHDLFLRRRQDGGYTVTTAMTEHTIGPNSFRYFGQFQPSRASVSDIQLRIGKDVVQPPVLKNPWNGEEVSPFESNRVMNSLPSKRGLKLIRKNLSKRVPELANVQFVESWAGMMDATPDVVPVMDQVSSRPGLFLATGFSGHGFGIGPGAGRVMADMVSGNRQRFNLDRFRFSRFSDGTKLKPGPAI